MGTAEPQVAKTEVLKTDTQAEPTDGFQLVIDALKLNGLDTIYGLPGIPITDLTRRAQAAGLRVLSFRHEQNAGYAASIAGFLTQKPGICLTVSAPGFLNGLNALAHATVNCFPMILISGSSEREVVDLQQGDYEELDQLAIARPLAKAAYRVLHAEDIGVGIARAIRAAVSGRPGGVYLDLPAKLFTQAIEAGAGQRSLIKVVDPAPRQIPAPDAVQRALELLKGAKKPLIILGKGAAYAQADADIRALSDIRHDAEARARAAGGSFRVGRAGYDVERLINDPQGRLALRKIQGAYDSEPEFRRVCASERILDVVEDLIGPDIYYHSSKLMFKPARGGRRKPWHQDFAYWSMMNTNQVTVWMAVDPA